MFIICRIWKSYGVDVFVSTADISSEAGCEEMLRQIMELGPVGGIFTVEVQSANGKLCTRDQPTVSEVIKHLDETSERLCPNLKHFVNLSATPMGQNKTSLSELKVQQIIQQRSRRKLPAKFIQLRMRDFDLVTDLPNKLKLTDSEALPQKISFCLDVLDMLLCIDDTLVQCMV